MSAKKKQYVSAKRVFWPYGGLRGGSSCTALKFPFYKEITAEKEKSLQNGKTQSNIFDSVKNIRKKVAAGMKTGLSHERELIQTPLFQ